MKTVCYIDASNLMKTGYKVDYKKLAKYLEKRFNTEIIYFGAMFTGEYFKKHNFLESDYLDLQDLNQYLKKCKDNLEKMQITKQINFIKKLKQFGFQTKIKPLKIMLNGKRKADCDVNITVEGMGEIDNYNKIVLFSGDGDFLPFLRFLKNNGKDIEVYSFHKSTAKEIRNFLKGNWHNLEEKDYKNKLKFSK